MKKGLIKIMLCVLLNLLWIGDAYAEEVPAEYKEFWNQCQQKSAELGGLEFVYDSSLLEVVEHIKAIEPNENDKAQTTYQTEHLKNWEQWIGDVAFKEQYIDGRVISDTSTAFFMTVRRAVVYEEDGGLHLFGSRLPKDGSDYWTVTVSNPSLNYNLSYVIPNSLQYIENGVPVQDGWRQIGRKENWFFFKDGKLADNTNGPIDGKYYRFDFYGTSGHFGMFTNQWIGDAYYGSDGAMLVDTITPDGYRVGADGKKIARAESLDSSAYALELQDESVKNLYETVNAYRQANGKPPVVWSQQLTAALYNSNAGTADYGIKIGAARGSVIFPCCVRESDYEIFKGEFLDIGNNWVRLDRPTGFTSQKLLVDGNCIAIQLWGNPSAHRRGGNCNGINSANYNVFIADVVEY